jgi:heme exporter protein B
MSELAAEARIALAIASKDVIAELRGRHAVVSTLFFAALVLLLFGFALGPDARRLAEAAPGLLWLAILFAGVLALGRLHQLEADDGALEQLALYPVRRRAIYLGKALAGFVAMLATGVVLLGAAALLYEVDLLGAGGTLALILLLGTLGIAAVGTFYAAITLRMRAREQMLPLLMLPVLAPLLLATVKATAIALGAGPSRDLLAWIELLVVFDAVMLVAGAAVYGYLLEE